MLVAGWDGRADATTSTMFLLVGPGKIGQINSPTAPHLASQRSPAVGLSALPACLGTIVQMGGHRHITVSTPQAMAERLTMIW